MKEDIVPTPEVGEDSLEEEDIIAEEVTLMDEKDTIKDEVQNILRMRNQNRKLKMENTECSVIIANSTDTKNHNAGRNKEQKRRNMPI